MMKAIFISNNFDQSMIEKLNEDLKDCYSVEFSMPMKNSYTSVSIGVLLIVRTDNRRDKLKKIHEIVNNSQ